MDELVKHIDQLRVDVEAAVAKLDISSALEEIRTLDAKSQEPNFWSDNVEAQRVMKRRAALESHAQPWIELQQEVADMQEIALLNDTSVAADIAAQLELSNAKFESLKAQLKLSGPYDSFNAIVGIYAGAGGTDAQDWAQMLLRMYTRWAEKNNFTVKIVDESGGDEAGIKSVTLELSGPFTYGKLKGEHGVHRLVRLSPFNADNLRQTSFAKVEVLPEIDQPDAVEIDEKDLKIDVYRSGGHGGQSVNTTDSAVRITHVPTGITVAIQNERSQLQNKETAMTILRSRLAQLQMEQHAADIRQLKGPNEQAAWGNQIRSYVLHPYKQVKDLRTRHETSDPDAVLDGDLEGFIDAYLEQTIGDA